MDYLKSFWWKQPPKDEPNHVEFSTVTTSLPVAANSSSNNPAFLSIIHEVKTTTASSETLPSPNESFHTVKSSFNQPETTSSSMGVSNIAYTGSHQDMTTPKSGTFTHHQHPPTQQVYQESYWSWTVPWSNWNQREKIFLLVIVILSLCILSLTSALSVVLQKNIQYRDLMFEHCKINL